MRPKKRKKIEGKISIHPKGFGFVSSNGPEPLEVFIPPRALANAMDGDLVEAEILAKSSKGFDGRVTKILSRSHKKFVCIVTDIKPDNTIMLHSQLFGEEKKIILQGAEKHKLTIGDRILTSLEKTKQNVILCKFKEHLGNIEEAKMDTAIAIIDHGIRHEFPNSVIKEARALTIDKKIPKARVDFTKTTTVTIDPTDAKDYDDALSIEKFKGGGYRLGIHIADVSHFVTPDSSLDREAIKRANSTYFPSQVVPMLPEELSNDLCSLKEGVNRYTASILVDFNQEGEVTGYKIFKAVINSDKRFTYEEAREVLDGKKKSPYKKELDLMVELCKLLKNQRKTRGSVELAMTETVVELDDEKRPIGTKQYEYDITHQMVEEFMLKANEIVAKDLIKRGKESIFRVHEEPDSSTLGDFFTFVRLLGYNLPPNPNEKDIQQLFERSQKSRFLEQVAIRYIRSMKLASYSNVNIGHYGLSLEHYTHFTSPIRRYSDLVIHRLLFDQIDYTKEQLEVIAKTCSEKERKSFKAEMSVVRLKKLRYLDKLFEEDPYRFFDAIITMVKENGIFFDLTFLGFEGFLPISRLGKEYFTYREDRKMMVGERSNQKFALGDKIKVEIESLDLIYGECEWALSKK